MEQTSVTFWAEVEQQKESRVCVGLASPKIHTFFSPTFFYQGLGASLACVLASLIFRTWVNGYSPGSCKNFWS